jgi:hypothetical protein
MRISKSEQSLKGAHRDRVCMRLFIGVDAYMYISIYIYAFLKRKKNDIHVRL